MYFYIYYIFSICHVPLDFWKRELVLPASQQEQPVARRSGMRSSARSRHGERRRGAAGGLNMCRSQARASELDMCRSSGLESRMRAQLVKRPQRVTPNYENLKSKIVFCDVPQTWKTDVWDFTHNFRKQMCFKVFENMLVVCWMYVCRLFEVLRPLQNA